MWADNCWIGNFKDVWFYTILNLGYFFCPLPSPLTFHNVKNHGGGGPEGEPRGIAREQKTRKQHTEDRVGTVSSKLDEIVTFHQKPLSSKTTFIKNHFHQKPLSSNTTFIKHHFHPTPLSSNTSFIQTTSIKNHFHQKTTFIRKPLSSKKKKHFLQKPLSSKSNFENLGPQTQNT